MTKRVKRIVLEATEDGSGFTAEVEPADDDTEGHIYRPGRIVADQVGDDASTYRVQIDGDDVEGHALKFKP